MKETTTATGLTLFTMVFFIFLILKLAEIGIVATWSWWWVFSPLWIPVAAFVTVLCGIVICYIVRLKRKK